MAKKKSKEESEKLLFLTSHLAEKRLKDVIDGVGLEQDGWAVRNIGSRSPL